MEFLTEEEAKENLRSPSAALLCVGLLRRDMVYELERVMRVCGRFFFCMSVTYDCAVAVVAHRSYFASASYINRKSKKRF